MNSLRANPNRLLLALFVVTAVVQTALPIAGQKLTGAIVYSGLTQASIVLCVVVGMCVAAGQLAGSRANVRALAVFYIGLFLLVVFDVWIAIVIAATC